MHHLPFGPDAVAFSLVAKALADPQRFRILEHLCAVGECSCGEVVGAIELAQATVSHHLKVLVGAGLVDVRQDGTYSRFSAKPIVVHEYALELQRRIVGTSVEAASTRR